jgi:trk system potassium uptake protein TrkA
VHIVIAGQDEVAFNIAEGLMASHEVVLIGASSLSLPRADKLDVEFVCGSPTNADVLKAARADRAGIFVAATESDEQNLVACIAARRMGAKRTICILSRPGVVESHEHDEQLAQSLGLSAVVRPSVQLADELLRIVTVPGALDVEHFFDGKVHLMRHVVDADSPITRGRIADVNIPKTVTVLMARRGEEMWIPSGDTVLEAGDKVTALGTPRGIRKLLFQFLRSSDHGAEAHRVTIVGGGEVGVLLGTRLEKAGWRIKLIETDRERCEEIAGSLKGLVVHGDGSDIDLLEEERVTDSPVLVAVTSNDEKNLLISLIARHLGVERVITRANRLANEILFERVGIDVVRSARGAAIRKVVFEVVGDDSTVRANLEHGDVDILELEIPADAEPHPLSDYRTDVFAIVGALKRGSEIIITRKSTIVKAGDHLLILATDADIDETRQLFLGGGAQNGS